MSRLRDDLGGGIGGGRLSLRSGAVGLGRSGGAAVHHPDDTLAGRGRGPVRLAGDERLGL